MKVSGFFMVRHGVKFDYPFRESLRSLLPLVDELVVNVDPGEDTTLQAIRELADREPGGARIRIIESRWPMDDPEKRRGGMILAEQTNLALDACAGDWCIYLQADEVLHEAEYPRLRAALAEADARPDIDGLLFDYRHFYGSYDVIQSSRSAYRREVRAIRRAAGARSVGDAQSFRLGDGRKLRVLHSGAHIFHYGWVRPPEKMREKTFHFDQLYHGADPKAATPATTSATTPAATPSDASALTPHSGDAYKYKRFWGLYPYRGDHPAVMRERIATQGWHWDLKQAPLAWEWADAKKIALDLIERATGARLFEYRSYRLVDHASSTEPRA